MTLVFLFTFAIGNVWADTELCSANFNGKTAQSNSTGVAETGCTMKWGSVESSSNDVTVSGNTYRKFGNSGYVQLILDDGEFQAGDKLTVTMSSNQNNKSISYKLHDKSSGNGPSDITVSSGEAKPLSYTLTADDIESDGSIKIFRGGSANTNARYGSFSVVRPAECTETAPTSVAVSGGATYDKGDALSNLSAAVTGGTGTMSYQWYRNTTNAATVSNELKLANCTTATLAPSNKVGTYYYYCVASNCAGSVTSNTTAVTINPVCPPSGTIYKFQVKTGLTNGNLVTSVPKDVDMTTDNYLSALVGGELMAAARNNVNRINITGGNAIGFANGADAYLEMTLDCAIQAGDIIKYTVASNNMLLRLTSASTEENQLTLDRTKTQVEVPAAFVGATKLYMIRAGSSPNISYFEVFRPVYRTITLEYADGVTPDGSLEVVDGEAATKPADPTWAHHRFDGWYNGSDPYDWSETVGGDLTLTAHWTQLYTISFNNGGGSGDAPVAIADKAKGETFTVPENTFTAPTTKEFDIWNDGSADYAPGVTYTVGTANVVLTAKWKALQDKYTVIFKDGDVTLDTKQFDVTTNPSDANIEKTKPLYTFAAWQKDAADIALDDAFWATVAKDAEITLTARWEAAYASSINIEQWVLTNGAGKGATTKTSALLAEMGTKNYLSNIAWENKNNELDTLDDSKTDGKRNYAYLGLKVRKDASNVRLLLQDGKSLKVKFGNVAATPNIKIGDADATAMTITDGVYSLDAASGDREITISTTSAGAVVIKQIMINEDIAAVTLPWRVTYDANGGTCATAEAIWSGAALILPDVTPADADHTFAGWYDEVSGGSLQGVAGASYNATDNITLHAQFAPVEYAIAYDGNGATSGSMSAGAAGWGTLVTPDANAFEKTGHVFSGWEITKTSDGSATGITFSEGKFEMPKYDVTLVAQWEDNSKVAVIVETNVKYNDLAAAIEAAEPGQTVQLIQDINQEEAILIAKNLTLDLNNKTFTVTNPSSEYSNRAIKVTDGTIVIENGTVDALSNETHNSGCWGSLRQEGGHLTCNNVTFKNYRSGGLGLKPVGGTLILNECTVLSEFGGGLELGNATVVVNNCTFTQTGTDAQKIYGACFGMGKMGTLTINGGTYTSDNYSFYIYTSGGTINVNSGTFAGDVKTEMNNTQYPSAVGTINISGGTFDGVGENPIVFTAVTANDHISISGGVFDAPIENQYCAYGYVPKDNGNNTYGVTPKDGVCLIKGNVGDNTFVIDEDASLLNGTPSKNNVKSKSSTYQTLTGWKFNSRPAHLGLTLSEGTFQKGDVVEVFVTSVADDQGANDKMRVFTANDVTKMLVEGDANMVQGANRLTLPETTTNALYLVRGSENADYDMWNPYVAYFAVYRPMMPKLTAITINGEACVKGEGNTFSITLPEEGTNLASLEVVPTIIRNAAHATTPEAVVSNEGAWKAGDNTYRVMDKDGDYTDYTITITLQGEAPAPVIATQPAGVAYCAGSEPTLTVDATGNELHYAWFKEAGVDDEAVGTDAASYTVEAAGTYYVIVTNHVDGKLDKSVTSENAIVTLNVAAAITTQPTNKRDVVAGSEVTLSVVATNATGYQWYSCDDAEKHGAAAIPGAEAANYVFTCNANGFYYCVVGNACGEDIASNVVSVKLEPEGCNLVGTPSGNAYTQAGEWSIYPVNSSGQHDPEGNDFGTCKAFDEETDVNCVNTRRFAIKFEKDVESVTIYARGGTGRTFDKVSVADEMAKNAYTELTDITKQLVTIDGAGKEYIATAEGMIPGGKYAWFDFSGSFSGVFKICYTTALAMPKLPTLSDQELCAGAAYETFNATITNAAACEGTVSYKWYSTNDTENPVAETAEFTPSTDGTYYVVVTHSAAGHITRTVQSDNLTVAHFDALTLVSNSGDVFQHMGTAATLSVVATGKNVAYVWYTCSNAAGDDAVAIDPAETEAELTIASILEDVHYYKVVISHDCDATTLSHIFKVEGWNQLEQVDVTASTVWDMTNVSANEINLASFVPSKQNVRLLLANIEGVNNNASFNSQALMFEGQRIGHTENNVKYVSGQYVQFNVTVPGMVSVTFASNGSAQRTIQINGKVCSRTTNDGTYITYNVAVEPGSVEIEDVQGYVRISKIEFKAGDNYHRTVNPNNIGTLCWTNNAVLGGATLYKLVGKNEYNKLVFEEVDENRLEAGKPYVFVPENGNTVIKVYNTDSEEALSLPLNVGNGMMGTFVDMSSADGTTLYGNYVISNNKYIYVDSNNVTVRAYRAYITSLDDITPANPEPGQSQNGSPRRRMMIGGENAPAITTGIENTGFESEAPRKVLINGELYIIRGEKMYDAKGQLVK